MRFVKNRPDSSGCPHTILIVVLVYGALSSVGRPDRRSSHWQFISLALFLPGGMLWGVLPHRVFLIDGDNARLKVYAAEKCSSA